MWSVTAVAQSFCPSIEADPFRLIQSTYHIIALGKKKQLQILQLQTKSNKGRFPFFHSYRNENFHFNQNYPTISVKSYIVGSKEKIFRKSLF